MWWWCDEIFIRYHFTCFDVNFKPQKYISVLEGTVTAYQDKLNRIHFLCENCLLPWQLSISCLWECECTSYSFSTQYIHSLLYIQWCEEKIKLSSTVKLLFTKNKILKVAYSECWLQTVVIQELFCAQLAFLLWCDVYKSVKYIQSK